MRVTFVVTLALAMLLAVHGLLNIAGGGSGYSNSARITYGLAQIAAGFAVATGLLISPRSPRLGLVLVAAGVLAISVLMYWFVILTVPVGVAVLWITYARGRRTAGTPASVRDATSTD